MTSRIRGSRLARPLASTLACALALAPTFACDRSPASVRTFSKSGFAMGTVADLQIVSADSATANATLEAAFAELARIEAIATIHSPESEVSRVNRAAGSAEPVPVGADLDAILQLGVRVARESNGAFDPTVGPLVRLWGFPEHPAVPRAAAIARTIPHVGWERLERSAPSSDGAAAAWRLEDKGMSLDLGGIACGVGVDRAGDVLRRASPDFLINIGGDILVGGSKPDGSPWAVAVQNPRDPERFLMTLHLRGPAGVSTSGDYEHFVMQDGVRQHHILDPKTGWPARGLCSVTLVAPDCSRADAESKPAFILGPERGFQWVEDDPDLDAVFVVENPDGSLAVRETSGIALLREEAGTAAPSAEKSR